jgi:hypothetical protein
VAGFCEHGNESWGNRFSDSFANQLSGFGGKTCGRTDIWTRTTLPYISLRERMSVNKSGL